MVVYFCHPEHGYTLRGWLEQYGPAERGEVQIVPYTRIDAAPSHARAYVFSDIERLETWQLPRIVGAWDRFAATGATMLNHPTRSLRRFDLQQALSNDFRLFRERLPADARYPLFLRYENDHGGAITPLLWDAEELHARWKAAPTAIALEFLDTSDAAGVYRKYSAMRVGDALMPRHVLFSHEWQVKDPDLVSPSQLDEERRYLETFPHREGIMSVFDRANIQYGRIDYAFHDGRLQVWEINTNPMLQTVINTRRPERIPIHRISAESINRAFLALAWTIDAAP